MIPGPHAPTADMVLRVWHLVALALAAVLLAWLVLPGQPAVALVALAGIGAAALFLARATGIQLELETQIRWLLDARDRERALVEAERCVYLERLRGVEHAVAEQHRALADLVQEIDRMTEEARLLAAAEPHPPVPMQWLDRPAMRVQPRTKQSGSPKDPGWSAVAARS